MDFLKEISNKLIEGKEFPNFKSGDQVTVYYTIKEGKKNEHNSLKELFYKEKGLEKLKPLQ